MRSASLLALAVGFGAVTITVADDDSRGIGHFTPIAATAYAELTADPAILETQPWIIPAGYTQRIVSDESDLDISGPYDCATFRNADWPDMTVSNETGRHAGRYLYRTHEIRPFLYASTCTSTSAGLAAYQADGGGAISVVDRKTGEAKILAQRADWEALDGLLWTPWGTLLFAEEAITAELPDPGEPQATSGLLYELVLDRRDPTRAVLVAARPLLGSLSHEGIETDAQGNVYVIDEDRNGSIYKFVPEHRGDLSAGQLYALRVQGGLKTGAAEWVALDMDQVQVSARVAAAAVNATRYCRPEDLERIGKTMYVALTCEDTTNAANLNGPSAVLAFTLNGANPQVSYFVAPGVNVPVENRTAGITGMRAVDNLADGPDGSLWIVEDNVPSDIWVASPDRNGDGVADEVRLFASLKDNLAEGTGIYFGKDPKTLYVNVQHSATGNDKTMAITQRRGHDRDDKDEHDED